MHEDRRPLSVRHRRRIDLEGQRAPPKRVGHPRVARGDDRDATRPGAGLSSAPLHPHGKRPGRLSRRRVAARCRERQRRPEQDHEAVEASALQHGMRSHRHHEDGGRTRFEPVVFDVTLPGEEGVYDVVLEAVERGSLRWSRAVVGRTFQVPAVALEGGARPLDNEWRVVHELDPGSPKLHERLRRLPGVGLGDVPLPSIGLPAMPLPSFTRPSMVLPRLPAVPALSAVPSLPTALPSISSMVPRLGGLLATGHSRVEPHPLGPVLRLPAAESPAAPTWEGIVIAGVPPSSGCRRRAG